MTESRMWSLPVGAELSGRGPSVESDASRRPQGPGGPDEGDRGDRREAWWSPQRKCRTEMIGRVEKDEPMPMVTMSLMLLR